MQRSRIGPFALEETLDREGEGNVLRGLHLERKKSMAVKLLPPSLAQQLMGSGSFANDVKRLQQLVHPGIVRYYGGTIEQGQPYLALELVEGESLRERLDRRGKLPWEMAVEIADELCIALEYAHRHGVVHQRLTPTRVLLPEAGGVKITGFDCVWADRDEVLGLRVPMQVAQYLAPEVFRGKQSATLPPCDLFSVGVILYECISGELPWEANSPSELVQARRAGPAPRVATKLLDCPVWLDVLVAKLLAVKRSERLGSADETHRAIVTARQKVAAGMGTMQHAISGRKGTLSIEQDADELRQVKRQLRRKRKDDSPFYERAWFLALCLLLVLAGGVWSLMPLDEETLFARAQPLMESESPVDWKRAEEQYLKSLRKRFPDSKYASEIQAFDDRYAMYRADTRARNNERLGRSPESEAERQYVEASRFEKLGDKLTAWQKYEALISLFAKSDDPEDQAYVKLAELQIRQIKSDAGGTANQSEFLRNQLSRAQLLVDSGELLEARRLLDSLVQLYDGNQQVQPLVNQAREQIRELDRRE